MTFGWVISSVGPTTAGGPDLYFPVSSAKRRTMKIGQQGMCNRAFNYILVYENIIIAYFTNLPVPRIPTILPTVDTSWNL